MVRALACWLCAWHAGSQRDDAATAAGEAVFRDGIICEEWLIYVSAGFVRPASRVRIQGQTSPAAGVRRDLNLGSDTPPRPLACRPTLVS